MFIINFCLNMFRTSLRPSSGEQRPCVTACGVLVLLDVVGGYYQLLSQHVSDVITPIFRRAVTTNHIQQNQRSTPHAVTHSLCSPEDGRNDVRNMLRQKLIIKIWLLHLVGFSLSLSLSLSLFTFCSRCTLTVS